MYEGHEPFSTFRDRALDLALHKVRPDATRDEINIEHMDEGGMNRIVGISRGTTRYILRTTVLAPQFLCCAPPLWLWAWKDDDDDDEEEYEDEDEDELTENDEPPTEEERELKRIFEDAAGPIYHRFTYSTPYRLARQLALHSVRGLGPSRRFKDAINMLKEWKYYYHVAKDLDTSSDDSTSSEDSTPNEDNESVKDSTPVKDTTNQGWEMITNVPRALFSGKIESP
ncbi:hypothetical protein F5Y11DRAFT_367344 [Daldinia sp. FL1419]|nr:hypothetical protein F5Y11DRAFT_367344 [Daldinia sp. FL1419]